MHPVVWLPTALLEIYFSYCCLWSHLVILAVSFFLTHFELNFDKSAFSSILLNHVFQIYIWIGAILYLNAFLFLNFSLLDVDYFILLKVSFLPGPLGSLDNYCLGLLCPSSYLERVLKEWCQSRMGWFCNGAEMLHC